MLTNHAIIISLMVLSVTSSLWCFKLSSDRRQAVHRQRPQRRFI